MSLKETGEAMGDATGSDPQQNDIRKKEAMEHFQAAYELQVKGDLDRAVSLYRKSLEVFPTAEAHTFLGWSYSFMGKYDEAIAECRRAIEVDPDFGNPYNDIGAYLIEKGRYEEAIPWLEKATTAKRYDSYCFPHYNLGRVWEAQGDWARALECYRNSVNLNHDYALAAKALNRIQGLLN